MKKRPSLSDPNAPITTRQLIEHTNIDPEARAAANMCLPAAHQATLSNPENGAIETIENRVAARRRDQDDKVKAIREQLPELPDPRTDRNLQQLPARIENLIMGEFSTKAPVIKKTVAAERIAKAHLNTWRDANNLLDRDPVYPLSKIKHFAWVVLIVLTEAAGNTWMYLTATPHGLSGAFTVALLIATCNVGIALAAGLVPARYLNLPAPSVRLWAIPALILSAAAILFLNAYAAHFREVASNIPARAFHERLVIAHLLSEPFTLSLQSYALFVFGLLCASATAWKGYHASDPYPGYEAKHRPWAERADDLAYLKTSIHAGLDAITEAEIVYVADKPLANRALLDSICKEHAKLLVDQERAQQLDASDVKVAIAAINRFRERNLALRTDGVTPHYFSAAPDLSHVLAPGHAAANLTPLVEAAIETHLEHTEKFIKLIAVLFKMIETAKDNTDKIMAAIEKSYVDEKAIPDISELRRLITPEHTSADTGDSTCTNPTASFANGQIAAAS